MLFLDGQSTEEELRTSLCTKTGLNPQSAEAAHRVIVRAERISRSKEHLRVGLGAKALTPKRVSECGLNRGGDRRHIDW